VGLYTGLLMCGLRVCRSTDVWVNGSVDLRVCRSTDVWVNGSVGLRVCGSTGLRVYCCVGLQVCRCTDVWAYGSTGMRVYGSTWIRVCRLLTMGALMHNGGVASGARSGVDGSGHCSLNVP
jgi:hypothetical protein